MPLLAGFDLFRRNVHLLLIRGGCRNAGVSRDDLISWSSLLSLGFGRENQSGNDRDVCGNALRRQPRQLSYQNMMRALMLGVL